MSELARGFQRGKGKKPWTATPFSTNCVKRSTLIITESSSVTWEVKNSLGRGRKSRLRGTPGFYTLRNNAVAIVKI